MMKLWVFSIHRFEFYLFDRYVYFREKSLKVTEMVSLDRLMPIRVHQERALNKMDQKAIFIDEKSWGFFFKI